MAPVHLAQNSLDQACPRDRVVCPLCEADTIFLYLAALVERAQGRRNRLTYAGRITGIGVEHSYLRRHVRSPFALTIRIFVESLWPMSIMRPPLVSLHS